MTIYWKVGGEEMTKGFGFELEKDKNGKFVIRDDTPKKAPDKFYRQKDGGGIYFVLDTAGRMDKGVLVCLEVAKQEKCRVICNCDAGLVPVTPEMSQTDALNTLTCHKLLKEKPEDEKTKKIAQLRAKQIAPESIGFEDFYFLDKSRVERAERIINFCDANDINIAALRAYYDLAVEYAKSQGGLYKEQVNKVTEHFGIPEIITQENLPELRKKLVLSRDDPRVAETQKINAQQYSKGRVPQNG